MQFKHSLVFTGIFAVLLLAVAAKAEESAQSAQTVQVDTSQCVEREVLMMVKSTRGVHYSERDEGRLISERTIKIKDCGGLLLVDRTTTSGTGTPTGRTTCPPGVQDCIRP